MYLGQEDCPPSTFGLLANGAAKLFSWSELFLVAILSTEKRVALSSRLQCNYLSKKSVKTLRKMIQLFSTTVALFTDASRNRVDVEI